ncbi:MAG: hypothetical protein Q8P48_00335 [Deltaproteobacteria bacterium]|nr:hypothetical protein [Deltaproteobacteria bacterium]
MLDMRKVSVMDMRKVSVMDITGLVNLSPPLSSLGHGPATQAR